MEKVIMATISFTAKYDTEAELEHIKQNFDYTITVDGKEVDDAMLQDMEVRDVEEN